jgi:hypothetical protein
VHWIPALRTANDPEVWRASWVGQILHASGETLAVVGPDGSIRYFRNHDIARLVAVNGGSTRGEVLVNDRYPVLRIGTYCFSVRPDTGEPLEPCTTQKDVLAQHPDESRNVSATRQNRA